VVQLIPAELATPAFTFATGVAVALEIIGALFLILGNEVFAAQLLAAFLLLVTPFTHLPGALSGNQDEFIHTMKNLALLGACFILLDKPSSPKVKKN
jgi:uncharacterized membrane protein YphA (DoxX/SURF4 family)